METRTTVVVNGEEIPFEKWVIDTPKKLRIKLMLANTMEDAEALETEIRKANQMTRFVNATHGKEFEHCMLSGGK